MRLWHESLIHLLPRQQLLGQHRECCALRGNGWGKKHSTVDYVFNHSPYLLYMYHMAVIHEMDLRRYKINDVWLDENYRGKNCNPWSGFNEVYGYYTDTIYPEHNDHYLKECLDNLASKGIHISEVS